MKKLDIHEMQELAKNRSEKCLSEKFINQGSWSLGYCNEKRRGTIEEMQKIAKENGGKCLSEEFFN